jgi:hypothetical protein
MKKYFFILLLACLASTAAKAHEPLYGFGPHVLFKGGFAPHITVNWKKALFETEYALGYGITRNWTIVAETPWTYENGNYKFGGLNFKTKYRFLLKTDKGISHQASFLSKLVIPRATGKPTVLNLALTAGQEALKFYWFASAGYALKFSNDSLKPGNNLLYNVSIGYRPFKVNYYKPDIVFFVETTGNVFQKSRLNGDRVSLSGGADLAIAPTFFFTYKNFALRGGIQFGLLNSTYIAKTDTNIKLTVELHI